MLTSNIEVTEPGFYVFLKISAHLTGFNEEELASTGMHETYYYNLMKEGDQATVRSFLTKAEEILKGTTQIDKKIAECFLPRTGTKRSASVSYDDMPYHGLARRIILLWYTGLWTTMNWKDTKSQDQRTTMVSSQAYKQGLIWTAAETHPAGAKQPGPNSWGKQPLSTESTRKI
jgi:hypothetical protein